MPHTPGPPARYTFSARISDEGDDWTDIEMRSDNEKYTVATVEDRFAKLFLAAPEVLACLIEFVDCIDGEHTIEMYSRARAAIRKAEKGE